MNDHSPTVTAAKGWSRHLLSASVGSEVAEAALVLPLVFMMLLGIYWFGRAFNIYATITHAAQQGLRAGVAQTCATCAPGNSSVLTSQTPTIITNLMQASHVDPNQIQVWPTTTPIFCPPLGALSGSCSVSGNITTCNNVQITPATQTGVQVCGATASFQYPYQFWLPFTSLNNQQITLKVNVQMKGEY
jgi:hypothetical protein